MPWAWWPQFLPPPGYLCWAPGPLGTPQLRATPACLFQIIQVSTQEHLLRGSPDLSLLGCPTLRHLCEPYAGSFSLTVCPHWEASLSWPV